MKKYLIYFILLCTFAVHAQDTLRIATWNTLNFPEKNLQNRIPAFRKVINEMNPDILVIEELTSASGVDYFLNDILNYYTPNIYYAAPFVDGPDTDNMLFYKKAKLSLLSNRQIHTNLRDFSDYVLQSNLDTDAPIFHVFAVHLKANSTASDSLARIREARILREELNQLSPEACFFVVGDFNLYTSKEGGYQELIGDKENNNGQCFDPINKPGSWHNYSLFSKYHTQSTRVNELSDGGASGGLDDRFDFILISRALTEPEKWYCLPETYKAFGNDGRHFNSYNINDNTNFAVADSIADALYIASDHLPVCVDFTYTYPTAIAQNENLFQKPVSTSNVLTAYPNPFNAAIKISYHLDRSDDITIDVYNIYGQYIETLKSGFNESGNYSFNFYPKNLSSGVYFIRWQGQNLNQTHKILYLK